MNIINICFNALFIYGLGMGVLGAALATLLGRVFAAAWVFWQQQQIENPLCIRHIADMKPDGDLIRRILGIGIPSGLENGMFQIGKLCVSSLTSTLGTSAIAANAVANTISGIANIPGSTMGLAMIPVVSRCLGAGDKKQAKHYAKMFILMAMLGLFCTNACLFLRFLTLHGCSAFRILRSTCALPLCTGSLCSALSAGPPVLRCPTPCAAAAMPATP